jgi:hypothetical protein
VLKSEESFSHSVRTPRTIGEVNDPGWDLGR